MFRCCPRIDERWREFKKIFFFHSLSLFHIPFRSHYISLPVDYTQSKEKFTIAMLCAFSLLDFHKFFFSWIIIDNIVDIVLLSLSLCRNSLLDNMGKQFCGCECGYFFHFSHVGNIQTHNLPHTQGTLASMPSLTPPTLLYFFFNFFFC